MRKHLVRLAVAIVAMALAFLGAGQALAAPASNPTVATTATVTSTLTLSLNETSFSFGSGVSGSTLTGAPSPVATVVTNDNLGYQLDAQASVFAAPSPSTAIIDAKNLTVTPTVNGVAKTAVPLSPGSGGNSVNTAIWSQTTASAGTGDVISQAWTLAVPASAVPAVYSDTLTFMAVGL